MQGLRLAKMRVWQIGTLKLSFYGACIGLWRAIAIDLDESKPRLYRIIS